MNRREAIQQADWWEVFHVPEMADLFLVRSDPEELRETLDFLCRELRLNAGSRIYDQCCGIGSLTIALAGRGMQGIGVDQCDFFIERAIHDNRVAATDCEFRVADAFQFTTEAPCDGVLNWYTSFGYAASDEQNLQMFHRAFESLNPNGRFALDFANTASLLRGFQRHMVRRGDTANGPATLIRESEIDLERGRLNQIWTWLIGGKAPLQRHSSLKLYSPHQIREMLELAGFGEVELFGGIGGAPLTMDSPRLIATATRLA